MKTIACQKLNGSCCAGEASLHKQDVASLLECAGIVLHHHQFVDAVRSIFEVCKRLIGAQAGYVTLLDNGQESTKTLVLSTGGQPCNADPSLPRPIRGLRGMVYKTGQVRYDNAFAGNGSYMPEGHVDITNILFIPLKLGQCVVGLLGLANKEGGFTAHDVTMGEAFGEFASLALQNTMNREKLQESEENHRRLVNVVPDALLIGSAGKIVFANEAAAKMVGLDSVEALIGSGSLDFISPADHEKVVSELALLEEGSILNLSSEVQLLHQSGGLVDVEVSATPFIYQGERAQLVVARDVTVRKKMEQEMVQSAKLEGIGILAGGIAHDFNNLLTIILGNLSIAKMSAEVEGNVAEKLQEIENAALMAKELSGQLLSLSKGRQLVKKTSSLPDILKELVSFAIRGTNVSCTFAFPTNLPLTDLDTGQFSQVINNLIINAIQAMPDGGEITVSARPVNKKQLSHLPLEPGSYILISITDQGCGIPREDLARIFEPFYTTKSSGNGLGLTTSYRIIKNHGGHMTVESEPGRGTVFSLYLPVSIAGKQPLQKSKETVIFGRGRVLLMDDDEAVRSTTGEMLRLLGYDVDVAVHGEEVLECYRQAAKNGKKYDLYILDKTVRGGMGGQKTLELLQRWDPTVKAVLSSGYTEASAQTDPMDSGFCAMISKPYNLESLSSIVKHSIQASWHEKPA